MQQGQNLTRHGEQKRQRKPRGQKEKQQRAEQEQQRREREQEQKQQRRGREQEQKQQRAQRHMQRMLVQEGLEQPGAAQPQPAASVLVGSRKRKQRSPVRVAHQQMVHSAEQPVQQGHSEGMQRPAAPCGQGSEGSLPPTRPASPAVSGGAGIAPLVAFPSAMQQQQQQQQQQKQGDSGRGAAQTDQGRVRKDMAGAPAATPALQQASTAAAPLLQPSQASVALMAGRAAEAAQRRVEQAARAFAGADRDSPSSMLRPLQQLLLALSKKGGSALQVSSCVRAACW